MRAEGHEVLHDIVCDGFNIDHVVVGTHGIYTVETKTLSKPVDKRAVVDCDGDSLLIDGKRPTRHPIAQSKAQAVWLKRTLKESTGHDFRIQPVVAFPGWFVEPRCKSVAGVWIAEPKALAAFIRKEQRSVAESDAKLATFRLRRIIRGS